MDCSVDGAATAPDKPCLTSRPLQQLLTSKSRETALEHQMKQMKAQMAKLKLKAVKDSKDKEKGEEKEGDEKT